MSIVGVILEWVFCKTSSSRLPQRDKVCASTSTRGSQASFTTACKVLQSQAVLIFMLFYSVQQQLTAANSLEKDAKFNFLIQGLVAAGSSMDARSMEKARSSLFPTLPVHELA